MIKKYSDTAVTKTHGLVDGSLIDLVNPAVPLDTFGETVRMGVSGAAGWVLRGKKETGNFGF